MPADDAKAPEGANPNGIVHNESVGRSWVDDVPGLRERRAKLSAPFVRVRVTVDDRDPDNVITAKVAQEHEGGIEELHERGLVDIEPIGERLLLRGVMPEDAVDAAGVKQPDYDGRRALLHEVVALGPAAAPWLLANGYTAETMLKPGDLVWVLTTVADRLAQKNKTVRYITVPARYIGVRVTLKAPTP